MAYTAHQVRPWRGRPVARGGIGHNSQYAQSIGAQYGGGNSANTALRGFTARSPSGGLGGGAAYGMGPGNYPYAVGNNPSVGSTPEAAVTVGLGTTSLPGAGFAGGRPTFAPGAYNGAANIYNRNAAPNYGSNQFAAGYRNNDIRRLRRNNQYNYNGYPYNFRYGNPYSSYGYGGYGGPGGCGGGACGGGACGGPYGGPCGGYGGPGGCGDGAYGGYSPYGGPPGEGVCGSPYDRTCGGDGTYAPVFGCDRAYNGCPGSYVTSNWAPCGGPYPYGAPLYASGAPTYGYASNFIKPNSCAGCAAP